MTLAVLGGVYAADGNAELVLAQHVLVWPRHRLLRILRNEDVALRLLFTRCHAVSEQMVTHDGTETTHTPTAAADPTRQKR